MAKALIKMHDSGYIHCDLHGGNINITYDSKGVPEAHLLDFGLSTEVNKNGPLPRKKWRESLRKWPHYAPEAISGNGKVNRQTDVCAVGHLLRQSLEIMEGQIAFDRKLWRIVHAAASEDGRDRPTLQHIRRVLGWYIDNDQ